VKKRGSKRGSEATGPTRHRATQGMVNRMAELRRQGLTFQEIGARVGCSERTARRKVGQVEPQVKLPQNRPEPERDPDVLRERLARIFAAHLQKGWERWPSARFVAEANRQFQERLAEMDPQTLHLVSVDGRVRSKLFLEVAGPLYRDFVSITRMREQLAGSGLDLSQMEWRPPRERKREPPEDDEET
jgi:hypothetical protein